MSNAFMLNYAVYENFYDGDPSYTLIYNTTKSGAPCHPDCSKIFSTVEVGGGWVSNKFRARLTKRTART